MLGCVSVPPEALNRSQAKRVMFPDNNFLLTCTLSKIHDPYQGGQTYLPTDRLSPTLLLFSDGRFIEYDAYRYDEGEWYLHEDHDKMSLIYQVKNHTNIPASQQDSSFRYQIKQLNADTLILAQQGRHGMVSYFYSLTKGIYKLSP